VREAAATVARAADFGWFAYTPLSDAVRSPSVGGDLWIMGLWMAGLGTILGAVNFITTIICRGGSISFDTPMVWTLGFLVTFRFGGLTGVILASPPLDLMPRRYADYLPQDGFTTLNQVSTVGSFLLAASTFPFLYNVWISRNAPLVGVDDPWGWGRSLEWATSCPPPRHNFESIPRIRSESPAFDLHHPEIALMELDQNPR
jgi:heme/copper-type cytochrome/quinol oxidase subunit 1